MSHIYYCYFFLSEPHLFMHLTLVNVYFSAGLSVVRSVYTHCRQVLRFVDYSYCYKNTSFWCSNFRWHVVLRIVLKIDRQWVFIKGSSNKASNSIHPKTTLQLSHDHYVISPLIGWYCLEGNQAYWLKMERLKDSSVNKECLALKLCYSLSLIRTSTHLDPMELASQDQVRYKWFGSLRICA